MPKLRTPLVASIGALLLVGALFLSLFLSTTSYRTGDDVVLTSDAEKTSDMDKISGKNLEIVSNVAVDRENVQQVISSLARPKAYTATISNRLYYGDELSGQDQCRQSVKNGAYRVDYLNAQGETEYTELVYRKNYYAWRAGRESYVTGKKGSFTTDQSAMIPTYETICKLPKENIVSGAITQQGDELFLAVDTKSGNDMVSYFISLKTGMLHRALFSQNGKRIRTVEISVRTDEPQDQEFILPGQLQPVFAQEQKTAQE